ncbi:MAG: hypothetical protein QOE99_1873 [Actinomycetota bacterium]|jgi:hypothetical protein|nr:hypothetical protein [Actinomycetota bacterium]
MSTIPDEDLSTLLDELASSYDVPSHGPDEILAAVAEQPKPKPIVRHGWFQLSAAAAVIGAGLVFLASTGTNSESAGSGATATSAHVKAPAATTRDVGKSFTTNGTAAGSGGAAAAPAAGGLAPVAPVPAAVVPQAPLAPVVNAPPTDSGEARVVKTGSIALVVKDKKVSPTLKAVNKAASLEGGYIASSSSEEFGDTPSGEVTIRVPVDRYEKLVDRIRGLDAQVRTATSSGKDVTAQFTDLESQLRTLNATRDRFLTILGQTKTISEILTVQQRVDNVSGQIDRIEGQKKLLASQSDLSTLTVSVSESGDPVVKATNKPRSGISQAFTDARDGFVNGVEAIIRHSGGFLLFLICAAVVLLLGRLSWRVARRRMV